MGAFWDKVIIFLVVISSPYKFGAHIFVFYTQLSLDEANEVVSLKDVTLEVLTWSFISLCIHLIANIFELQGYVLLACNMLDIY